MVVMSMDFSPTLRLKRLAAELRRLREQAGMTTEQVERHFEWGYGKISRLENRKAVRPTIHDIRSLLDLYGVTDERVREGLLDLARQARERGWWQKYRDVFSGSYVDVETEASVISNYEPLAVPGLLQTPAYAAELNRAGMVGDEDTVQRFVDGRMERQKILKRHDPPHLWAVIDEGALLRPMVDPATAHDQILHLAERAARRNVTIQIVPWSAGLHAGLTSGFVILDFPHDPSVAYLDLPTGSLFLEDPDEVQRYRLELDNIRTKALDARDSVARIKNLAEQAKGK
jgi:transcriptional regulator with XRE-family HTH domain